MQSVGEGDSEKMLNERQLDIAKRAKDVQKLRAQFTKDKQKELQQEQLAWLQEEVDKRTEKGEIGVMAHMGAVQASLARYATEFSKATRGVRQTEWQRVRQRSTPLPRLRWKRLWRPLLFRGLQDLGDASVTAPLHVQDSFRERLCGSTPSGSLHAVEFAADAAVNGRRAESQDPG